MDFLSTLTHAPTLTLGIALLIDLFLGEPPNRWHPVAWMGSGIAFGKKVSPKSGSKNQFLAGATIVLLGCTFMFLCGWMIQFLSAAVPMALGILLQAFVLKCCFGVRALSRAAGGVRDALEANDLNSARQLLAYHLVSRNTSELSEHEVSAATIESVSENTSDSIVGPLICYALGGLPAALAYRFINTCDAMLGYRTPELEWLGKFAARADDLVNLIPARLTAWLMILASICGPFSAVRAVVAWWRDRKATDSPNAGQPMSVAAGALGVSLSKPGQYHLFPEGRDPTSMDIAMMARLFWQTVALAFIVVWSATYFFHRLPFELAVPGGIE